LRLALVTLPLLQLLLMPTAYREAALSVAGSQASMGLAEHESEGDNE
jgi:hypothetical protein